MNDGKTMQAITPLYDDVDKWANGNWRHCLNALFFRDFALAQCLKEQLKARPNVWGKGLWKDEETEKIAERCAQIFVENFLECPNERLRNLSNVSRKARVRHRRKS